MDLKEASLEGVYWIDFFEDRDKWRAFVFA